MRLKEGQIRVSLPKSFDAVRVLEKAGMDAKYAAFVEFMVGNVGNWRRIHRVKPDSYLAHDVSVFRTGVPKDLVAKLTRVIVPAVLEWKDGGKYRFGTGGEDYCRSYRFAEEYRDQPLRTRVLESASIWERVRKHDRERTAKTDAAVAGMGEFHRTLRDMESQFTLPESVAEDCGHPIAAHLTTGNCARHRWYIEDDYHRVHHPLVASPNSVRKHLTLSGSESISQVDVSGSQIILLFLYITGLLPDDETEALAGRAEGRGGRGEERRPPGTGILSGLSKGDLNKVIQTLEWLITGEFSERLREETNRLLVSDGHEPWTAAEVKQGRLSALFGHWKTFAGKPVGRALNRMCPAFVAEWMRRAKRVKPGEFARKMQAVESGIMLHGAARRLIAENPGHHFGTLHDAIMADTKVIKRVTAVIQSEWELAVGIAPPVKCQLVSARNAQV